MNSTLRHRVSSFVAAACLCGWAAASAYGQSFYSVSKVQNYTQTTATGSVVDPGQPFSFKVSGSTAATLTLPAGGTQALTKLFPTDDDFTIEQNFATKTALDTAYPNGTYRITGTGIPTLSFNLTTDTYPTTTPQVTNGTWNAGGLLVVNPAQATTINFNPFATYASAGVAGHMEARVEGLFDNVRLPPGDNSGILSVANPFGITVTTTPLTTLTIPAGTLTSGRVYQGAVSFETATTFDTTTLSGGGVVAIFSKVLNFYIAAQNTGTTTPTPVIIGQPANVVGVLGGTATFGIGVTVGGFAPTANLQILWYFNGQQLNLDGTKYSFPNTGGGGLMVRNLTAADVGAYTATLINAGGIVTTNPATLTLAASAAPVIVQQPLAKNVASSSTVVFSVIASGTPAPTYQWRKDGVNLTSGVNGVSGATSATLVINSASSAASAGSYSVVVTNSVTSVTSTAAALTVIQTNDPGRLTNLSVLTDITPSVSSFTVATVVGGAGTSGTKPLVVRVVGPSLAAITGSSAGLLPAPKLDLFLGQTAIASNNGWGGGATIANAMASVGAFAFINPTSSDAAVFQPSLAPGSYSVIASGVNGATGLAIAEIYDAAAAGTFTPSSPRLVNVSVLKQIVSGGSVTLGFTIGGSTAKTVLIRIVGPGLAAVGLTSGTLGDPQLTLFNSSNTIIATNDDWGADPQLINAESRVGAFLIGNNQSKDSMLITTLSAGGYTARATGNGGTSGTAIVEVYEVP